MNRNLLLTRANIRKAKGQTAAIIVLVLLSSMMMNLWLMLATDYKKNFERYHDKLNDGHVNIAAYISDDSFTDFVSDTLDNSDEVTGYSMLDAFCGPVSFEYNGGELSQLGILLKKEDAVSRTVGKFEITEDSNIESGIYLSERFGSDVNAVFNINAVLEGSGGVYVALMTVIVIAILIISCIVIVFVMYLLVRTLLNNKKRDYGILKALGYTTGQLVLQTALSFMPSVIISSAVGIFISMQLINPLMALFLSGVGIVKSTFVVPVGLNVIAGAALILFAFAAACLMSLRVRKIATRELLIGE